MASGRIRRPPPSFRTIELRRKEALSPRLLRLTLGGPELEGFSVDLPAASVRLLLPPSDRNAVVIPSWTGNEFLHEDGQRPVIRTYTPRYVDTHKHELVVDVVLHERGAVSAWAIDAQPGAAVAVSGPGRGYEVPDASRFLLAGDETAIPAISQLLEHLPPTAAVDATIEVAAPDARLALPEHPGCAVRWIDLPRDGKPGDALHAEITTVDLFPDTRIWVAGEAAGVQRIRRHLFEERDVDRAQAVVRGYWKAGRGGDA